MNIINPIPFDDEFEEENEHRRRSGYIKEDPVRITDDRVKQDESYLINLFTRFPGWRDRLCNHLIT